MRLESRLWPKVDKGGPDECWEWIGARNGSGYGHIGNEGRVRSAHRVVYELLVGPIPDGLHIDHLCRNRGCVNPDHLEPVTPRENTMRSPIAIGAVNAAKTHCPKGHPYDEGNTLVYSRPGGRGVRRLCRTCAAAWGRARRGKAL